MAPQLTLLQRARVKVLFDDGGFTKRAIARQTGFSLDQVRYTLKQTTIEPGFSRRGARQRMSEEHQLQMIEFAPVARKVGG